MGFINQRLLGLVGATYLAVGGFLAIQGISGLSLLMAAAVMAGGTGCLLVDVRIWRHATDPLLQIAAAAAGLPVLGGLLAVATPVRDATSAGLAATLVVVMVAFLLLWAFILQLLGRTTIRPQG